MHLAANFFPQQMELGGVMIACHDYQILGYKNSNFSDLTFNQTRNPLKKMAIRLPLSRKEKFTWIFH